METKHAPESAPGAAGRSGWAEDRWDGRTLPAQFWPGMLWMNPWVELWTSMWAGWLGQGFFWQPGAALSPAEPEDRQADSFFRPPRVEPVVVPLHHPADWPARRAHPLSMRGELPGPSRLGAGNVIAIDVRTPRSRQTECQGGDSGPNRGL